MKQVQNNVEIEGRFMIQDHDHMVETPCSGRFMIQESNHLSGVSGDGSTQCDQDQSDSQQQGGEKKSRRGRQFI